MRIFLNSPSEVLLDFARFSDRPSTSSRAPELVLQLMRFVSRQFGLSKVRLWNRWGRRWRRSDRSAAVDWIARFCRISHQSRQVSRNRRQNLRQYSWWGSDAKYCLRNEHWIIPLQLDIFATLPLQPNEQIIRNLNSRSRKKPLLPQIQFCFVTSLRLLTQTVSVSVVGQSARQTCSISAWGGDAAPTEQTRSGRNIFS